MLTQVHTEYRLIVAEIPSISKPIPHHHRAIKQEPVMTPQDQSGAVAGDEPQVCDQDLVHRDLKIHLLSAIGFVAISLVFGKLIHQPLIVSSAIGYGAGTVFTVWIARFSLFQRATAAGRTAAGRQTLIRKLH